MHALKQFLLQERAFNVSSTLHPEERDQNVFVISSVKLSNSDAIR